MGTTRTYTRSEQDQIIAAIRRGLASGKRVAVSAVELGITESTFYRWLRERARAHEVSGGGRTSEEKARIVAAVRERIERGQRIQDAARAEGVSDTSYYNWAREARQAMPAVRQVMLVASSPMAMTIATPAAAQPTPSAELALVTPDGYRLIGLDIEGAAALLKALA